MNHANVEMRACLSRHPLSEQIPTKETFLEGAPFLKGMYGLGLVLGDVPGGCAVPQGYVWVRVSPQGTFLEGAPFLKGMYGLGLVLKGTSM